MEYSKLDDGKLHEIIASGNAAERFKEENNFFKLYMIPALNEEENSWKNGLLYLPGSRTPDEIGRDNIYASGIIMGLKMASSGILNKMIMEGKDAQVELEKRNEKRGNTNKGNRVI